MDRDVEENGLANQVADEDASLGEAWTQAKSKKPAPYARPEEFEEFRDNEEPHSTNRAAESGEPVVPEHAEPPSNAGRGAGQAG